MNTFIALLRGINVGGNNIIKMEHLKQMLVSMGFSDVKTYIQSGNVIFRSSESDKLKLTEKIENQLQKNFYVEGTSNNSVRHCGLDPQSPENKEILKQVQNDGGIFKTPLVIKTLILTADDLAETVKDAPENFGVEPEKFRYDVWFLLPPTTTNDIVPNVRLREGVDFLQAGKNVIYAMRLTSEASRSYFPKIMQMPFYKSITIRNWNTTRKLLELAKKTEL